MAEMQFQQLTDDEWRTRLTPEQYAVTRQAATEPPFTGKYWNTKEPGVYRCVCLRGGAVQLRDQVRLGHRMAELLRGDRRWEDHNP